MIELCGVEPSARRVPVVYRCYRGDGALLYVGASTDLHHRIKIHRKMKPWWPDVARVTFEEHPGVCRRDLLHIEHEAIRAESPAHNLSRVRIANAADVADFAEKSQRRARAGAARHLLMKVEMARESLGLESPGSSGMDVSALGLELFEVTDRCTGELNELVAKYLHQVDYLRAYITKNDG